MDKQLNGSKVPVLFIYFKVYFFFFFKFLTDLLVVVFINTFTCFLSTGGVHGVECS